MKYGSTLQYLEAAHQIELSRPRLGLVVLHQAWSSREIAILPAAARTAGQSFGFDAIRIDNAPARKRYVSIAPMNGLLRRQYEAKRSILTIKKPCNAL